MSQQKVLIALCLVGAIGCASAQIFNWRACSEAVRAEARTFQKAMTQAGERFTRSLQQTGASVLDTSAFQKDMDKLIDSVSSLANMSDSFDMSRFTNMYMENVQTMASMMRNGFSLYMKVPSSTMNDYIELGNAAYTTQTKFLQSVTSSCLPARRIQTTV